MPITALRDFVNEKAHAWALARQGEDATSVTLNTRRVYILPTRQGVAFAVLLLAMLLASLNYNNSLGLALTFLLGGLGVVAMHHCHHNMVGLTVRLQGVQPVFAGQRAEFRFVLEGRGDLPRYQFELQTDAPGPRPRHARPLYSLITDVPGDAPVEVVLAVPTRRRGRLSLVRVGIATRHPFGLFRAWSWLHMNCSVLVYPRPAAQAPAISSGEGDQGGRHDERRGEEDFSGLRSFQDGDSPRHIAWKAYARDQEPRVKQYAGTTVANTWLDFDALQDPDAETRLRQLTRQLLDAEATGTSYGLRLPPGPAIAPGTGATHRARCLAALALYGDAGEESDTASGAAGGTPRDADDLAA